MVVDWVWLGWWVLKIFAAGALMLTLCWFMTALSGLFKQLLRFFAWCTQVGAAKKQLMDAQVELRKAETALVKAHLRRFNELT